MKVLQVTNARSPFFQNQLSALDAVGVDYDVSAPRTGTDGDRTPADYLRYYPDMLRTLRDEYDLVHVNYGLMGPFGLAQPTRPLVLSLWGSDVMGSSPFVTRLSGSAAARADAVVAPSRALAAQLSMVPDIVPFGIDTDRFRPIPRADARDRVGWARDETIALFPYDSARSVKNYPLAESVVESVDADVSLKTISGVPYEDMPYYLNASDLVLVTSNREAGPMVVKEATACNVPVVSTNVGFVPEILTDVTQSHVGTTERDLVEGVEAVLDSDRRANGPTPPDVLSIESMGERLLTIYERITR